MTKQSLVWSGYGQYQLSSSDDSMEHSHPPSTNIVTTEFPVSPPHASQI